MERKKEDFASLFFFLKKSFFKFIKCDIFF